MSLPEPVLEYLRDSYVGRVRTYCFSMDESGTLLESWGDPRWCGFEGYEPGDKLSEKAPYLSSGVGCEPNKLEFVSIGSGVVVHLHTVPHSRGFYVLLFDAGPEHDDLQKKQQSVNELRLMYLNQQRLIGRQKNLISELVEAKAELDHHRREAERGNEAKGQFIAMMSHEFRTPLASIISYSDLAREDGVGWNDVGKSLEAIGRSSRHLASLVEAVLDDARLDARQVTLQERDFDVYELVEDLSAIMAPLAAEKELSYAASIEADVPSRIKTDDVCLRQILVNLLGNAVKFTERGSIRLALTYANGRLVATVTDTGPGIDSEDQERVFRAFERGERSVKTGAGLGLTITLRLAKLMGGEVSLDSQPGMGCTIGVHVPVSPALPVTRETRHAFPTPSSDNIATNAASVLVCDDDEDMLALIEFYLHRAGYALIATANGTEAVQKTIAYQPDLVLMDVNVPGTNGVEAAQDMRKRGFEKPIVALTASRLSTKDAGKFTMCFRKPAPMQELLTQIKRLTHDV